jgi:hypothetical protein
LKGQAYGGDLTFCKRTKITYTKNNKGSCYSGKQVLEWMTKENAKKKKKKKNNKIGFLEAK